MDMTHLFRLEAMEHRKQKQWGGVSINAPLHWQLITILWALFLLSGAVFLVCAEFSEHCVVKGFLNVLPHVARVYPMEPGVVDQYYVTEGEHVKRGDRLLRLSRSAVSRHELQLLQQRQDALRIDLLKKNQQLHALTPLLKQHYVSNQVIHTKQDEVAAVKLQLNQLALELARYQRTQAEVVHAPIAGIVSNVLVQVGQQVQAHSLLLSILPEHAEWGAELLVPASLMRFIERGKVISLRIDAYPYQHFGTQAAVIEQVSQLIATDADEDNPIRLDQPYYKIWAKLAHKHTLPQGMTLDAMINGSKKTVWRWLLPQVLS
jgi:membrane fusion protein